MTVAVFVSNASDAASLIPWGVEFSHADRTNLLIVCPRKSKGKRGWDPLEVSERDENALFRKVFDILDELDSSRVVLKQAIESGSETPDKNRIEIETRELIAPSPEAAFVEEINGLDIRTLLLPEYESAKGAHEDDMLWAHRLFMTAPCQVIVVRGTPPPNNNPMNVLVACEGEMTPNDELSISRGFQLANNSNSESLTLVYVRPDDDDVASDVAEKHLNQLTKSVNRKKVTIEKQVVLADSFAEGINRLPLESFDLVVVGTQHHKTIRTLFRDVGSSSSEFKIAVAAVRDSVPFTSRVWVWFGNAIRSRVPQLDRQHRVTLVDRLQTSSVFDFDFIALISLSTLIAGLGLARNSGAVVIGAMLVAPLMTPLVAMGFALIQGNEKLIRSALKSVLLGFTVALAIGATIGLCLHLVAPHFEISQQMRDRGKPNLLDFVVALASGVAGAYAMGRPNLNSAVPGVAIAAALVPPIATAGLALTMGDPTLAAGASLLFFTNIVAIVLGTAITFWAVGISTRIKDNANGSRRVWPRYWFMGFVIISILLATWISVTNPLEVRDLDLKGHSNIQGLMDVD